MAELITSITDLKAKIPVHNALAFSTVQPFINKAEKKLKSELLSTAEFDALITALAGTPTELETDLSEYAKGYVANLAMYLAAPHLRNHVSSLGIQQSSTDRGASSRPAPVADYQELRLSYLAEAYEEAELLLEFLEANKATFTDWAGSGQFSQLSDTFVNNKDEYQRFLHVVNNRQLFLAIKPYLLRVDAVEVKNLISEAEHANLKAYLVAKAAGNDVSGYPEAAYIALIEKIKPYQAYAALFAALPYLNIKVEGDSLLVDEYQTAASKRSQADYRRFEQIKDDLISQSEAAKEDLQQYLLANVDALELYKASATYAAINPNDVTNQIEQANDLSLFRM